MATTNYLQILLMVYFLFFLVQMKKIISKLVRTVVFSQSERSEKNNEFPNILNFSNTNNYHDAHFFQVFALSSLKKNHSINILIKNICLHFYQAQKPSNRHSCKNYISSLLLFTIALINSCGLLLIIGIT